LEEWRVIKDYPSYKVSNKGRVMSFKTNPEGRLMKFKPDKDGYHRIRLYGEAGSGVNGYYYVHRLVAEAFIPNPNNLPQVNHKHPVEIGDCDNSVKNLEWSSVSDNLKHKFKLGRHKVSGEDATTNKLTKKDVLRIVQLAERGMSHGEIAKKFPVQRPTISKILRGERWSEVTGIVAKNQKAVYHCE
jgi:hypothetical protein